MFDLQQIQRAGFEEVLRQMPAGVVIAEAPSGKIMSVNRRAQEWTEQSPSQTRRTKLEDAGDFEIFHPDGRTYEMEEWPLMRSIRDGEEVRDEEFVYPLADGTGLLLRCNSSPVYDEEGRIVAGVLVAHDITEQKRAEEKLKRSEERFRLMVEGVRDYAIFMLDPNGHIESWNEGARRIKGYSQEEILGQHFSIFYPPEDVERGKPERELREAEAKGVYEEEGWRVRKDGSRFWASVLITALRDEAGQLRGFSKVTRDISDRKRAEQSLEEVREDERSRIARDLHDEALQDLSGALVEAQRLRSASRESQPLQRTEQLIASLDRVGQQLRAAVYDLRLGGEQDEQFAELLASRVELQRTMVPDLDIHLEIQDGVLSGPLEKTGREILRIIGEALTNARRHSEARNVWITVETSDGKLWAEVEDDGRGFDVHKEPTPITTGGIGIRGMRERARMLGGEVKTESEPQQGTKVRFELALGGGRQEPGGRRPRVLLVEDHAAVREALAVAFEQDGGFEVVGQASSLSEATEMLGAEPAVGLVVDVAVVDLGLPDGYGGDLIRELRELNPRAQALVLSASLERAEIARAVEAGAAGVLSKTAHLDEVVRAVKRLRAGEPLMALAEVVELLRFAGSRREEEIEARRAVEKLTPREVEVLGALAEGLGSEQMATRLHISLRTERNHMANILSKLEVHSQLQALVFALRHGVVEIP